MTDHRTILIATTNPGKRREILAIVADLPFNWTDLRDHPDLPPAVESGDTFYANALIKAVHYSRLTGLWTLADDSGLEVDALDGAPGVHTSRYAGTPTDDQANNRKLLAALADVPPQDRTARFRCCVVLADGDQPIASAEGTLQGRIATSPRGTNGFGYDPIFYLPPYDKTSAELDTDLKNRISHRARALADLKPKLKELA